MTAFRVSPNITKHKKDFYTLTSKKRSLFFLPALLSVFPLAAQGFHGVIGLANDVLTVLNIVLVIIFVLALIVFSWGIVKYLTAAGDANKIKEARPFLFWGIIGLFVLAAIWGLVAFIAESIGIEGNLGGGVFQPPSITRPAIVP